METSKHKNSIIDNDIKAQNILYIFDFDGTLFNSPMPNPKIWKSEIGTVKGTKEQNGYGWFQDPETLSEDFIKNSTFIPDIYNEAKDAQNSLDITTVLLTGRTKAFEPQILKICDRGDLIFDEYYFKPVNSTESTFDYKINTIKNLINKYTPTYVVFFDDREKEEKRIKSALSELNIDFDIHHVNTTDVYAPEDVENLWKNKVK